MAFVAVVCTRRRYHYSQLKHSHAAFTRVFYCRSESFALSNASTHFSNTNPVAAAAAAHVIVLYRQRKKARTANPAQSIQTTNRKKSCWLFVWITADGKWRPPLPQCKIKIFVSAFAVALVASHHCCVRRMIHRLGTDWGGNRKRRLHLPMYWEASSCRGGNAHVFPNKDISMVSILRALSRREYIASQSVCETKWSMRTHGRLGWLHIPGAKRTQFFPDFPHFRCFQKTKTKRYRIADGKWRNRCDTSHQKRVDVRRRQVEVHANIFPNNKKSHQAIHSSHSVCSQIQFWKVQLKSVFARFASKIREVSFSWKIVKNYSLIVCSAPIHQ